MSDEKKETIIKVHDSRGTWISVGLYCHRTMIPDYARELERIWRDEYGGNAIGGTTAEFTTEPGLAYDTRPGGHHKNPAE